MIFPRIDFRVMHLTPGVHLELGGGLIAQAFDVDHSPDTRTLGFRVTGAERRQPRLPPDTGGCPTRSWPASRPADAGRLDPGPPGRGHLPMTRGSSGAAAEAGRTLFTHIGHRTGTHDELEEWLRRDRRRLRRDRDRVLS